MQTEYDSIALLIIANKKFYCKNIGFDGFYVFMNIQGFYISLGTTMIYEYYITI